jgi:uncharacterized protein (TIGR03000 family)
VTFTVEVPADAKVFVNGAATTSTGTVRTYAARGLSRGRTYSFNVRAEFAVDGKPVSQTKDIRLTAGETGKLVFDAPASDEQQAANDVQTKLTLHVPADAKVYLSGRETATPGEVREFITTRLPAGTNWENYNVRVTVERDGQTVAQERTITLKSGEAQELSFDLDAPKVASAK